MPPTAYRIVTPRLVLRCWQPADAALLKVAVDVSIEHLRPWMPWASHEPTDLDAKIAMLRRWRGEFDLDKDYVYGIFDRAESTALGSTGLHTRHGADAREIGYLVRADRINEGIATETAAALTRVAFAISQVQRVEIHCDVRNDRSAAVPHKLGYAHEATLRRRSHAGGAPSDTMIWTLFADEYPASPAAQVAIQAFDVLGQPLL